VSTQIYPQSKNFTEVFSKKQTEVVIQTVKERIEGTIYVFPSRRLLDEVNIASGFIAVTGARIIEGNITHTVDFVAVSVNHIVWMIEVKDEES